MIDQAQAELKMAGRFLNGKYCGESMLLSNNVILYMGSSNEVRKQRCAKTLDMKRINAKKLVNNTPSSLPGFVALIYCRREFGNWCSGLYGCRFCNANAG